LNENGEIRILMRQILQGLSYLNEEMGILHRDLKPDNIMVNESPLIAKIIDFGTCKDLSVETGPHTSYVSTRWYRAPECVLRSHHYNFNSDVFAAGCVMSEMYLQHPLFPGTSELDQIDRIFQVLGTPKKDQWREGYKLAEKREITFNEYPKRNLAKYLPGVGDEALVAIKLMLKISG
jgi:serine/threonine protein kinase